VTGLAGIHHLAFALKIFAHRAERISVWREWIGYGGGGQNRNEDGEGELHVRDVVENMRM
jgi:hypothetical protein